MDFLLALTPIVLILLLMVVFRWGAARAGAVGYLSALAIAVFFFGAGTELLAFAHTRALLLSLDVLMIIWAAFLFYRVTDEAGAIRLISKALPHLTSDRGMQALIIGFIFASFLQGVGGFGVPVAVIAPILVSLGFPPLTAVIIPSVGHAWSVTFGSLGTSFQALMTASGLSVDVLGPPSAFFLGIAALVCSMEVVHASESWSGLKKLFIPALAIGGSMGLVQYLVVSLGIWNLGSFIGSLAGFAVSYPFARKFHQPGNEDGHFDRRALMIALSGYVLLILIILGVQFLPSVKDFLSQVKIIVQFPEVSTNQGYLTPAGAGRKISIFSHAGMLLGYTSIIAYIIYLMAGWYTSGSVKRILKGTIQKVISSSVSIVAMVTMAVMMEHSGMTYALASGLSNAMGRFYPLVAPWIGALGAFMTGSNTNSNVVFTALQMHTADLLALPMAVILAAQTAGASVASIVAPAKIVVGTSTVGMSGKEGEVMRKLLVYTTILVFIISLLAVISAIIK